MSDATLATPGTGAAEPKLNERSPLGARLAFMALLLVGLGYVAFSINADMGHVGEVVNLGVFGLLGLALVIALGFEFVNGFHDTANAVATVIYTHSLPPVVAVVYSGVANFVGVLISGGLVAYSIITLLPVELILQVGSQAGYAMIFALLLAAIIWNLGTWYFGIPNSSSHALIGSIMGVGLANQLMAPAGQATSGVDWGQAQTVFAALIFSPLAGFILSALLLLLMKFFIRSPKLYQEPTSDAPPPWWIRGLLILTCGGVSFAHGNSDGQKGMGLIMLILIGAAPTAYALNRTMTDTTTPAFVASASKAETVFARQASVPAAPAAAAPAGGAANTLQAPATNATAASVPASNATAANAAAPSAAAPPAAAPTLDQARAALGQALRTHKVATPRVFAALDVVTADIVTQVQQYHSVQHVPAAATPNMRNDMYLAGDTLRLLTKSPPASLDKNSVKALTDFQGRLQDGTRFIPTWVKIAVALALGLGTMVGWKRIVVTVGEKIGKTHLTYGQGAAAELVAFGTIYTLASYGLPVSTTHILSSGVAGTMAANGSGLQWATLRNIALAWVTTLPAAIFLAGSLYWIFRQLIGG